MLGFSQNLISWGTGEKKITSMYYRQQQNFHLIFFSRYANMFSIVTGTNLVIMIKRYLQSRSYTAASIILRKRLLFLTNKHQQHTS